MPRKPTWPPPVHKHPSGRARCRINGKDVYLGPYGSEEAARAYAELLTRLASREPPVSKPVTPAPGPERVTVASVVARWFAEESPRYSAEGREVKQFEYACRPLLRLYGTLPAAQFHCDHLERVRMSMASGTWQNPEEQERARARGMPLAWSRNVVNRAVTRLRTIWRWAERRRLVPPGTFAHLCTLPGLASNDARVRQTQRRKPVEFSHVKAVLRHCAPQIRTMLLLQWWTGMRSAEVRLMRPCDLDRTGEVWIYRPHRHKTAHLGAERAIPLGVKCQRLLAPWLASRKPGEYLFRPGEALEAWNAIRRSRRKTKVQPSQLQRDRERAAKRRVDPRWSEPFTSPGYPQWVRRACQRAGVPEFDPYSLRHAFRMRIGRSHGLEVARAMMGHRSLGMTGEYGCAVDLQAAIEAAKKAG